MRSPKLSIVAATMLATLSVASVSFADDTTTAPAGATSTTGSTVMTPSSPAVPATTQTTTTVGTPAAPVATTTTTSADSTATSTPTTYSPPPAETTVYERRFINRPILITGGAILIGTYATTAGVTAAEGSIRDHDLYIPVVGPWINLASRGNDVPSSTRDTVLIAGSGVLQGVGAGMVLASFFIPEKVATATIAAGPVKMLVTPTAAAGAGGIGAFGTF